MKRIISLQHVALPNGNHATPGEIIDQASALSLTPKQITRLVRLRAIEIMDGEYAEVPQDGERDTGQHSTSGEKGTKERQGDDADNSADQQAGAEEDVEDDVEELQDGDEPVDDFTPPTLDGFDDIVDDPQPPAATQPAAKQGRSTRKVTASRGGNAK